MIDQCLFCVKQIGNVVLKIPKERFIRKEEPIIFRLVSLSHLTNDFLLIDIDAELGPGLHVGSEV